MLEKPKFDKTKDIAYETNDFLNKLISFGVLQSKYITDLLNFIIFSNSY